MGRRILEVIHIRFDHDAIDTVDRKVIVLVKRELHIRFAKLKLFPTGRGSRMQTGWSRGKLLGEGSNLHLIDQLWIAPGKEPVLGRGKWRVPSQLFDVVERG